VIDYGAYVWLLTDPVTAVGAAPLAGVPCLTDLPNLIKAKYATSVNRWTALQRQASPAGLLNDAVGGELARSRVWLEVMSRYRIGDVASAVFADQYGCWGFLDLWRDDTREPFSTADAEFIASLAAPLTSALRLCQARTFVEPATPHRHDAGPVVLTLDEDLRITVPSGHTARSLRRAGIMEVMTNSRSRRFPVTVTHLPVTRCQICHRTVAYRLAVSARS
jgi:hypothetical protein